ncbi:hypothetical protein [Sphingomonas xanthus]|uniref:Preprotein translocase subunit YajC n=1 Tax=Sphingomonas xanthus TaxID=2594473 RepID=A0A516ITV5_9SPHN|nr:hypothetical protein [Sphingomonas xanthus]QDP20329.1 hypothetical protein FMM02_10420 [Sphingomonas xanthus]
MRIFVTLASLSLAFAAPAFAQAGFAVGTPVTDVKGGAVGTVTAINGDVVTVRTDKHEANLGRDSFTPHEGKLLFSMTQAELNAAVEKDKAAAEASLVAGATVNGRAGTPVGTIDSIDSEFVTVKLASGKLVRLPRTGIAGSPNGAVIGLTADQLEAQVSATAQ